MPRAPARLLAQGTLAALLLLSPAALARPRLAVARSAQAAVCPDTDALTAKVEAVLGRPALTQPTDRLPDVGFDVEVIAQGEGFAATIRVTGTRQGQRTLRDDGPGCTGLGAALAVTLAMLLDEHAPAEPPPTPPVASSALPPPPAPPPPPVPPPPEPPTPALVTSLRLWLGGGLGVRLTPATEPLLAGGAWLRLGSRWSVGLDGFALGTSTTDLGPGRVTVSLAGMTARGCGVLLDGRWLALHACAALAGGRFRAEGTDYKVTAVARPGWGAGGLGLQGTGSLGVPRLGWFARLDALASLRAQSFRVLDVGTTDPLPRVGFWAVAGVSVSIW